MQRTNKDCTAKTVDPSQATPRRDLSVDPLQSTQCWKNRPSVDIVSARARW